MALVRSREGLGPPQGQWIGSESLLRRVREAFQLAEIRESSTWDARRRPLALARNAAGVPDLGWTRWGPFLVSIWSHRFLQHAASERSKPPIPRPEIR